MYPTGWSTWSLAEMVTGFFLRPSTVALGMVAGAIWGCGYSLVQTAAPFGADRMVVEPFGEEVPLGLSADLTGALAALLAAGGVRLSHDREKAAILRGKITFTSTAPSPTSSGLGGRVTAYRLSIGASATLVDRNGQTLWQGRVSSYDDFLPGGSDGPDPTLITEANRRRALVRAADKLAAELWHQLVMADQLR